MKKIIMLTDFYYPKPLANGTCIHQIAKAMMDIGYQVHVVCFRRAGEIEKELYEGIYIHRVRPRAYYRLLDYAEQNKNVRVRKIIGQIALLLHRIKRLLFFMVYPLISPAAIYRYYRATRKVMKQYNITNVIAQYCPFEAAASAYLLRKKNDKLNSILYVVDSFTNTPNAKKYYLIRRAGLNWERRFYQIFNLVINMDFHETHHQNEYYNNYQEKMIYLGIPLVCKKTQQFQNYYNRSKKTIDCVYAGALSKKMRNPEYLCKMFLQLKYSDIRLHFYTRGDCEDLILKYEEESHKLITVHSYLPDKEIEDVLNGADILVNIGNKGTQMVPSKVFNYISYGKPIIHVYQNEDDSCLQYLSVYPRALCIKEDETKLEEHTALVMNFIKENRNDSIPFDSLEQLFRINTPKYSAETIDRFLVDNVRANTENSE